MLLVKLVFPLLSQTKSFLILTGGAKQGRVCINGAGYVKAGQGETISNRETVQHGESELWQRDEGQILRCLHWSMAFTSQWDSRVWVAYKEIFHT